MENETVKEIPSSIFPGDQPEKVEETQLVVPTWGLIVILFICFFVLKSFIYTSDEKRHGK